MQVNIDNCIHLGYNYSYDSAYKKLEELYSEGILLKRQYFVKPANKSVYQITQKAAKIFGKRIVIFVKSITILQCEDTL